MQPYSLDLRERVVRALGRGEETQKRIAERFGVGTTFIKNLLKLRGQTGSITPRPHGGGMPAKYEGRTLERLRQELAKQPDATLKELRDRTKKNASIMAVFRALERLGARRKKSRSGRQSRSGQTLPDSETHGPRRRAGSHYVGSSSTTKAGPKPT
jgi:transposase